MKKVLKGSIVLSTGREVKVEVVLWPDSALTAKERKELVNFRVALHDLSWPAPMRVSVTRGPTKKTS